MLINEVIVEFSQSESLKSQLDDALALAMKKGIEKVSTEKLRIHLLKQNQDVSIEEIVLAAQQSDYVSSANDIEIIPANQLSGDVDTEVEPSVDVSQMAGDQALSDIKSEL